MSVAALCESLTVAGHYIEVFTTTANGVTELDVHSNKPVTIDGVMTWYFKRVTKDHTHFSPALLKAVWNRAHEFDVIHIHSWWNLVALLSCILALCRKKAVVVSPRGMLSNYSFTNNNVSSKGIFHKLIGKKLLQCCHLHLTSKNEKQTVTALVKPKTINILPNFVTLSDNIDHGTKTFKPEIELLYFSRIEAKKGLDILLHALTHVSVPYHLTIAGHGEPDYIAELKNIAISNETDKNITWTGFYGNEKFNLLRTHDLLVLPSHNENFGNVVIESLSVGTAVLVSENVGLSDYVEEKQFGWICRAEPVAIGKVITSIWQQCKPDLERIAQLAPDVIINDFTGSSLTKQYSQFYEQILQK